MNDNYLDNLVRNLINGRVLSRIFVLWILVTAISTALSISFVTNTASIAAVDNTVQDYEQLDNADYGLAGLNADNFENISNNESKESNKEPVSDLSISDENTALPERLIIEKLGIDVPVSNPQSSKVEDLDKELLKSVVRYPGSGLLGSDERNILIFGHSARIPTYRGFYRAFNDIETLTEGDMIVLESGDKEYLYRVSAVRKASATDGKIDLTAKNNKLTLVTCDGFGKKTDRWVVESDFIGAINK